MIGDFEMMIGNTFEILSYIIMKRKSDNNVRGEHGRARYKASYCCNWI